MTSLGLSGEEISRSLCVLPLAYLGRRFERALHWDNYSTCLHSPESPISLLRSDTGKVSSAAFVSQRVRDFCYRKKGQIKAPLRSTSQFINEITSFVFHFTGSIHFRPIFPEFRFRPVPKKIGRTAPGLTA